jgi:hypothetical protein
VGAIVIAASIIGMLASAATLTTMIVVYGGYGEAARRAAAALAVLAGQALESSSDGKAVRELAEAIVRFAPPAIAGSTMLMLCVNLYGAARSTELSRRLARPWPDLPTDLNVPWPLGALFLACAAAAFALPAPAAQYFSIGAGGLGGAFVLQGLAVAHALSRGLRMRPLMLAALYACCVLRAKYTLPVVAALGLVDAVVGLRARAALLPTSTRTLGK